MTLRDSFQEKVDEFADHVKRHPLQYIAGTSIFVVATTVVCVAVGVNIGQNLVAKDVAVEAAVKLAKEGYVKVLGGPRGCSGKVIEGFNAQGIKVLECASKSLACKKLGISWAMLEKLLSGEVPNHQGISLSQPGLAL